MNQMPLVSIMVPCYNGEKYIHRLLNSVLEQTYPNIELIIVDDGSTDKTKDIIFSYVDAFNSTKKTLVYLYQENAGQAAAINTAFKNITGSYLTWIDSDDFLKADSVEKRVNTLEQAGSGHFCITQYELVNEQNINQVTRIGKRKQPKGTDTFFLDLIHIRNVIFAGSVMIRTQDFFNVCPQKQIYVSREGQNWQLMLPIAYFYKCVYINEPLYVIVSHDDSHSRNKRSDEETVQRALNFITLITETIRSLNIENEEYFLRETVKVQYANIINLAKRRKNIALKEKYLFLYEQQYGQAELIKFKKYLRGGFTGLMKKCIASVKTNNYIRKLLNKPEL